MHANDPEMAKKWEKEESVGEDCGYSHEDDDTVEEAAKRDYKDEYKKFQSSDKSKKYRAELNKYNRKKGTYGNGDGKDASHKGGKISGFEKESVNRGRREKSRLKKEQKINESQLLKLANNVIKTKTEEKGMSLVVAHHIINTYNSYKKSHPKLAKQVASLPVKKGIKFAKIIVGEQKLREAIRKIVREDFAGAYPAHQRKKFDNTRRKQSEVLGYKLTGVDDVRTEIDDATVKEGNVGISTKKGKTIELTHKKSGKEIVVTNTPSTLKKYAKMGYLISMPEGKLTEAKESAIDVAKRVVQNKQHEKGLDLTTANFIMQVYNAYKKNPALQKKLEKLPLKKMISIVYKLIK